MRLAYPLLLLLLLSACGDDTGGVPIFDAPPAAADAAGGGADGPAVPADGAGGGIDATTTGIACGENPPCEIGAQCCVTFDGMALSYACMAATDTCEGASVGCDGPEDCDPDERCCSGNTGPGGGGGFNTECRSGGGCQAEVCHTAADCSDATDMCCPTAFGGGGFCAALCPTTP